MSMALETDTIVMEFSTGTGILEAVIQAVARGIDTHYLNQFQYLLTLMETSMDTSQSIYIDQMLFIRRQI